MPWSPSWEVRNQTQPSRALPLVGPIPYTLVPADDQPMIPLIPLYPLPCCLAPSVSYPAHRPGPGRISQERRVLWTGLCLRIRHWTLSSSPHIVCGRSSTLLITGPGLKKFTAIISSRKINAGKYSKLQSMVNGETRVEFHNCLQLKSIIDLNLKVPSVF